MESVQFLDEIQNPFSLTNHLFLLFLLLLFLDFFFGVGLLDEAESDSLSLESELSELSVSLESLDDSLVESSLELSSSLEELSELLDTCFRFFFDEVRFLRCFSWSLSSLESFLLALLDFLVVFDRRAASFALCF